MKYGPNTETVEAFLRHLEVMTPEQWAARDAAMDAAWHAAWETAMEREAAGLDAAWGAVSGVASTAADAASTPPGDAARYAVYEILGAAIMRERNQPFYFLPLFGFADPEAVLENDKKRDER